MDIDKLIGTNLKRIRKAKGLSQKQLAELIKTPWTRLSAYETGREGMGKDIMLRICEALNIKPYEFYIENDTPIVSSAEERRCILITREAKEKGLQHIINESLSYAEFRMVSAKNEKSEKVKKEKSSGS
ncbi:MAG: helix-turn-helix transcriptional regulator [Nitrospirae bacterium]|nr:helix-turn-helix transcriptional regulator [Nitrospirota bacterium]